MEYIDQLKGFYQHDQFFEYHGLVLSGLWVIACTVAIVFKRLNVYLHALCFFVIDVLTLYFVAGAWVRVYPHIDQFDSFSTIKKGHIVGGTIVAFFVVIQHLMGAQAIMGNKRSPIHRKFAWVVTNLARVVAYFGWVFGHYSEKQKMAQYMLIAAVVLFVLSTISAFFGPPGKKSNSKTPQEAKKPQAKRD